jgi:hypothetical protein
VALAVHLTISQMLQFAALGIASPAGIARTPDAGCTAELLGGASPLAGTIAHRASWFTPAWLGVLNPSCSPAFDAGETRNGGI